MISVVNPKPIIVLPLIGMLLLAAWPAASATSEESVLIDTIMLGERGWDNGSPSSVIVTLSNTVYVANRNSNTVHVIDAATNAVVDTITTGAEPVGMALDPSTNVVYVASSVPNTISVINATANTVTDTIDLADPSDYLTDIFYTFSGRSVRGLDFNLETNKIYVLINDSSQQALIAVIDAQTNKAEETVKVADLIADYDALADTRAIAVNSKTNMVYVATDFDSLAVIDGSNNEVVDTISVGGMPNSIDINEETNTIYVSNFGSQSISVIDGSTNKRVDTITPFFDPQQIEVVEETNTIYVTSYGEGVSIIDGASNVVKDRIAVGQFPEGLAFNRDSGLLYVAIAGSNSVSVVDVTGDEAWKTGYVVGEFQFSDPPEPDQIFKIHYRAINGTVEEFDGFWGFSAKVESSGDGILEVRYPRNYPYTNEFLSEPYVQPILFIDGVETPSEASPNEITDCFFVFSIPFSGSTEIGLAWPYLAVAEPHYGDNVPESCLPETMVGVPLKEDGSISPLQQFKAGVKAEDVICKHWSSDNEYRLVIHPDGRPFCVTRESATELIQRWGVTIPA